MKSTPQQQSARLRLLLFIPGAAGLAALLALCFCRLPGPDELRDRYHLAVNGRSVSMRNCTDVVSGVNFDFRGFDTLGEEFILFASVLGAVVLLREGKPSHAPPLPDAIEKSRDVPPSDVMRIWIIALVPPKFVWGLYIITHGQLTPGGGFQGGVILATVALIIYLGLGFERFRRLVPHLLVDVAEALGAGGFVVIGLLAFCFGRPYLTNFLPIGARGEPTSAGTIPLISLATGIEVAAGFSLVLLAFLQETLIEQKDEP